MKVVLAADVEPPASRFEYWQHIASTALVPSSLGSRYPFDAGDRLAANEFGAVRVGWLSTGPPSSATRTARHIRRHDPDLCKIDVLLSGRAMVRQDDRLALLEPGDFAYVDLSRPAAWAMSAQARMAAVIFPRSLLPLHANDAGRLTAVRIAGDRGCGALMSVFARQLTGDLDLRSADAGRIGTVALDLITVALAERLDRTETVPIATRRNALLRQVLAFIERHLGDPDLNPATIAAAHHISVRSLHALFESEPLPVSHWIRRRRMEQCRRDLLNPALRPSGQRDRRRLGNPRRGPVQPPVPRPLWDATRRIPGTARIIQLTPARTAGRVGGS